MSRDAWNGFLDEASEHAQAYMSATLRQFHEVHHAMLGMRGRNTRQRVAFWLLDQKQTQAETGEATIRIPLTRRDLASYLDMTVETLCRALHQLADLGAIDLPTPDFVRVLDVGLLRHVAKYPNDRPGHAGDLRTVGGGARHLLRQARGPSPEPAGHVSDSRQ
jgi:tRNA(Met) C34 N-acetyltransferase TmcA